MFIKLHKFLNQNKRGGTAANHGTSSFTVPFKKWRPGHVLVSSTASDNEEWTIKKIDSEDGTPNRECMATLRNAAGELREIKGSTLQKNYKFQSHGDVPVEPEAPVSAFEGRIDVEPIGVNVAGIREFMPRSEGREGCRVLMHDKTSYVVAENFEAIWTHVIRAAASVSALLPHQSAAMREAMHGR